LVTTALLAMLAGGLMITFDRRRRRNERCPKAGGAG
jgi:hypothetical protein